MPDMDSFTRGITLIGGAVSMPLKSWPETQSTLSVTRVAYVASLGAAVRDMPCARCDEPLGTFPFMAFTLISNMPCDGGGHHIPSVTVPIHVTCDDGDGQAVTDKIVSLFANCGD